MTTPMTSALFPLPRAVPATGRRHALLAVAMLGLAACGGGGGNASGSPGAGPVPPPPVSNPPPAESPASPPAIQEFSSDKAAYGVGDVATLTVRYTNGAGRIEPDLGAVSSGTAIRTSALDETREYRLVVESTTAPPVSRVLRLPVDYRDTYRAVPMAFRSRGHSATLADDGRVVLIGGSRGESTLSRSIDVYDPSSGGFRAIGQLDNGREGHRATRLNDGRILVTGGITTRAGFSAELVDERTGAALPTGQMQVSRVSHSATLIGNGRVLIVGGLSAGENAPLAISGSAEIYDVATGRFRLLTASLRTRRAYHSATRMPDGRVLILGGLTAPGTPYEIAEIFDPATETFSAVGAVDNRERGLHATAQLPDGSVLMLGGETQATEAANRVQRFEAGSLASSALANLLRPRTLVEAVTARDGRVFLFGGEIGATPAASESAESYSGTNGPAAIASLPRPRVGHTTTRLRDGRFLIVGGEDALGNLDATALLYE